MRGFFVGEMLEFEWRGVEGECVFCGFWGKVGSVLKVWVWCVWGECGGIY